MSGLRLVLVSIVVVVFVAANLAVFAWRISRRRVFTRGLRGTAVVIGVRRAALYQRKALLEAPTDVVTLATAAVPRGIETSQKLPAGQYVVGQTVEVVQHPKDRYRLFVDRLDLEPSPLVVYVPLGAAVMAPVILLLAAGHLSLTP
ncbi:MAG: hypothetical protein ACOH17_03140 [Cellulomonas sp.]